MKEFFDYIYFDCPCRNPRVCKTMNANNYSVVVPKHYVNIQAQSASGSLRIYSTLMDTWLNKVDEFHVIMQWTIAEAIHAAKMMTRQ